MTDVGNPRGSARTRVRRVPQRAVYDLEAIRGILDDALVGHLGVVIDEMPVVTPTLIARINDEVYVHGSAASRTLRAVGGDLPVCLTVTLIDGLVLARSAFHHSINYRSVIMYAEAVQVEDQDRKHTALEAFTEKLIAGRWADARPPTPQELKATSVMRLPIAESSAKVRYGPPEDEEADYSLDVWAGVLPLNLQRGAPLPDPRLRHGIPLPEYLRAV